MVFSNKVYDTLKWLCIIALPALSVLVKTLFALWQLPYGTEIATTITALATFLGALLMVSTANYKTLDKSSEE